MKTTADTEQRHAAEGERTFAEFLRQVGERIAEREAANPTPEPPPEPWVDKPGTLIAAEKDIWRWQLVEKLELLLCGGPDACKHARCRRSWRCATLAKLQPMTEASRATLAREQAQWKPPQTCRLGQAKRRPNVGWRP
jgi:hypothetical protein